MACKPAKTLKPKQSVTIMLPLPIEGCVSISSAQPVPPGLQELALKLKANGKVYRPKKKVRAKAASGDGAPAGATGPAKAQRGVQNARPGSRPQDIGFEGKEETGTRPDKPPQVRSGDAPLRLMRLQQHLHGATWASKQKTESVSKWSCNRYVSSLLNSMLLPAVGSPCCPYSASPDKQCFQGVQHACGCTCHEQGACSMWGRKPLLHPHC